MNKKQLREKLIEYCTNNTEEDTFYEGLIALFSEVIESIIPKENDPDRPFDNRAGTILEIRENINKLFNDEN